MCGFVSYVSLTGESPSPDLVARMTELVAHRGPDDVGFFFEGQIGLGFRRLAILDLAESGHQPMVSRDGRHVIVFNGEIFNYVELRNELEALGHRFVSSGDTEVLLAAYQKWGADCLRRFNGMWAFVIYDRTTRRVFAARDRFGVKPLYVFRDSDRVVLASEIKSIRDSGLTKLNINWDTAASFLVDGRLDHTQRTFYEGVESVAAGGVLEIGPDGSIKQWKHWSLDAATAELETPADPVGAFAELFEDAVGVRLRSDVSLGVLLSGGLDSTSIVCSIARQIGSAGLGAYCYSAIEFDETEFIAATIEQTKARVDFLDLKPIDAWNSIPELLWYQDEPVHALPAVVGYHLMKLARASGSVVLLNGQGADETLAGYSSYYHDHLVELLGALDWSAAWTAIQAFSTTQRTSPLHVARRGLRSAIGHVLGRFDWYSTLAKRTRRRAVAAETWLMRDVLSLLDDSGTNRPVDLRGALKYSLENDSLPLYLRIEDRNSMAHATEVRLPFLDYRLVSLAFRLDAEWKLREGLGKHVLRESMRGRIPENVRSRPVKFGFPTPTDRWFREDLYEPMHDLISSRAVRESGVWNVPLVKRELERHRRGETLVGSRLFDVAQFSLWLNAQPEWESRARSIP
jgi:asparagine synthase (glutamine-hydrolysing)